MGTLGDVFSGVAETVGDWMSFGEAMRLIVVCYRLVIEDKNNWKVEDVLIMEVVKEDKALNEGRSVQVEGC